MNSRSPKSLKDTALKWVRAGVSVLPIKPSGQKKPSVDEWGQWADRLPTEEEIEEVFRTGHGIGIIGGRVSGNLEILDFDVPEEDCRFFGHCFFDDWLETLDEESTALVNTMPRVKTPGKGFHLYYRCNDVEGNKKLACVLNYRDAPKRVSTIIETRGERGYVLTPGCPPECHPDKKIYELVQGDFESIPTITKEQRSKLFDAARTFDEAGIKDREEKRRARAGREVKASLDGTRPGDDFNRRGSWNDLLEPLGWTFAFRRRDGAEMWVRPGKSKRDGISATIREFDDGLQLFHAFTSNSEPFPTEESITKFTAYALIHHGGDYEAAARDLGSQGYGEQRPSRNWVVDEVEAFRGDEIPWNDEEPPFSTSIDFVEGEVSFEEVDSAPFAQSEASQPPEASIFNEPVDLLEVQVDEVEKEKLESEKAKEQEVELQRRDGLKARGPGHLVWIDSGDPPKRETIKKNGKNLIKTRSQRPRDTAWHILNDRFSDKEGMRNIHFHNEVFYFWKNGRYRKLSKSMVRSKIASFLTHFATYEGDDKETGDPIYKEFEVKKHAVTEMVQTVTDMSVIDEEYVDPCWLGSPPSAGDRLPDPREVVPCSNGLLDIVNRELLPLTPAFYSFTNTNIEFDADAPAPETWLRFLETALEDEESRLLLQEWFGYCLVQDTRYQKMMMVVGKPGSGKGTAVTILQQLIGKGSYCSMDFENLGSDFPLQGALGKSLMIFPDARQSFGPSKGNVVGTLLSISGEDDVYINRKHEVSVTQKLNTRIMIVSNDVINISDPSGALDRRMMWIKFPGFTGEEDSNLRTKLSNELSGILNWAIEGYHRVRKTGTFTEPESSEYLRSSFQEQSSPIKSFIEDMCIIDKDFKQSTSEIFKHWTIWRKIKGYKGLQSEAAFGKQLISADMSIKKKRVQEGGSRKNYYVGICLEKSKVMEFVKDSVGESEWDRFKSDVRASNNADIIDIFEWSESKMKEG